MAAQLLAGRGFKEVYNLKGGIKAWQGYRAKGPAEVGMAFIRGEETPREMITLAYGMEEGLRAFYAEMAYRVDNKEVSDLFTKLADIEVLHKEKIFELYTNLEPDVTDKESFENQIIPKAMEGGLTTEEFLDLNKPVLQTTAEVLDMAMTIEAQALDLYMRYSVKSEDKVTKEVLYEIAEEEKRHLEDIGKVRDKQV